MLTNAIIAAAKTALQAAFDADSLAIETWDTWPNPLYEPTNRALFVLHEVTELDESIGGGGALRGHSQGKYDVLLGSYFLPNAVEQGSPETYAGAQTTTRDVKERLPGYFKTDAVSTFGGTVLLAGRLLQFSSPRGGPFEPHPASTAVRHCWTVSIAVEVNPG